MHSQHAATTDRNQLGLKYGSLRKAWQEARVGSYGYLELRQGAPLKGVIRLLYGPRFTLWFCECTHGFSVERCECYNGAHVVWIPWDGSY